MDSNEIRKQFLDFFSKKSHKIVSSTPLFLEDDPSLLFVNAGMNQFKKFFLGNAISPYKRVANSQKCLRVSGKHNDLNEVGFDNYHHTFFEMLGSWSFGDYYKKEAIIWAWELMTEIFKLPKDKLFATVYHSDNESLEIWKNETDINPYHVLKFQEKDNFWEMGNVGPCGPSTEIHLDLGEGTCSYINHEGHKCGVNNDCERYLELWNLVFISYNRLENGNLENLSDKYIDTGMGLERIARVLQNKNSNYETDLFWPYIKFLENQSGLSYENLDTHLQGSMCVIADHIRALVFSIADGVTPSNTSRGYVLRRILRRAIKYGKNLGLDELFLAPLSTVVVDHMGEVFSLIREKKEIIFQILKEEEERFSKTLDKGLYLFEKEIKNIKKGEILSGKVAFVLYDTYGFPFDLTMVLCKEKEIIVDEKEFDFYMQQQKNKAKKNQQFVSETKDSEMIIIKESKKETEFLGYENYQADNLEILRYRLLDAGKIELILDKTPFYAESGGQVADNGVIEGEHFSLAIDDVQKENGVFTHYGKVTQGTFNPQSKVKASINEIRRGALRRHHSATHMLHKVVMEMFGPSTDFTSTYVNEDYFICELPTAKLSKEQFKELEFRMNTMIQECHRVETSIENLKEVNDRGIVGRFESKYKDVVRVVSIEGVGSDLCGGTHVKNTGEIGVYKLLSDTSAGTGVRRLESVAGLNAWEFLHDYYEGYRDIALNLRIPILDIASKIDVLMAENKQLKKELKEKEKQGGVTLPIKDVELLGQHKDISLLFGLFDGATIPSLKQLATNLGDIAKSYVACLLTKGENRSYLLIISEDLLSKGIDINALNDLLKINILAKGGGRGLTTVGSYNIEVDDNLKIKLKDDIIKKLNEVGK